MVGPYGTASEEKKYMAEGDLHTLVEAEKIKKDKARFSAAMKCRDEKVAAMQTIKKD